MRKTKCKECNGAGVVTVTYGTKGCFTCKSTGQIEVFTIQELREHKVSIKNDGSLIQLQNVLKHTFTTCDTVPSGEGKRYCSDPHRPGEWTSNTDLNDDLPTQSVKIFLEEIEQEENFKAKCEEASKHVLKKSPIIQPPIQEFKWGEEVEYYNGNKWAGDNTKYVGKNPCEPFGYVVSDELDVYTYTEIRRKPEKITITLQEIADKFKCKPEQVNIPDYGMDKR